MEEDRQERRRGSLRRFLVQTWQDGRRRNDAIWWVAATLFVGVFAFAYGMPQRTEAKRHPAEPQAIRLTHGEPAAVHSSIASTEPGKVPADEESEAFLETPEPTTEAIQQPLVTNDAPSTSPDMQATTPPHRRRRRVAPAVPVMSEVWVRSTAAQPDYTTTLEEIVVASSPGETTPKRLLPSSHNDPTAARLAAALRLDTAPTPQPGPDNTDSVGSTPPTVGSVNAAPEPGSLMLLLGTAGPILLRRPRRA